MHLLNGSNTKCKKNCRHVIPCEHGILVNKIIAAEQENLFNFTEGRLICFLHVKPHCFLQKLNDGRNIYFFGRLVHFIKDLLVGSMSEVLIFIIQPVAVPESKKHTFFYSTPWNCCRPYNADASPAIKKRNV